MTKIINISRDTFRTGYINNFSENAIAIQIADPAGTFPVSVNRGYSSYHQFNFFDADPRTQPGLEEFCMTESQAQMIAMILVHAKNTNTDVVVHCTAGICRSGAVVEAAVALLDFEPPGNVHRQPNIWVKKLIFDALIDMGYPK